jgi:serine/threonine protein kinase
MARLVGGRYELTALVGRGPHGQVWSGRGRDTGEDVAVKVLDEEYADDPNVVDRFDREYPILTSFLHPVFVPVRELIIDGGLALVTELVDGSDLRQFGRFAPDEAVWITDVTAEALVTAHAEGVVHCGIKPANLLLTRSSGELRITDSRVARLVRGHRTARGRLPDPRYAAPEVILGSAPLPATDVYGLGLVLYEVLTGAALVETDDPDQILREHMRVSRVVLPDGLEAFRELLAGCLAVDPAVRPTAEECVRELRRLQRPHAGEPLSLPPLVATHGTNVGSFSVDPAREVSNGSRHNVSEGPRYNVSEGPRYNVSEGPRYDVSEGSRHNVSVGSRRQYSFDSDPDFSIESDRRLSAASGQLGAAPRRRLALRLPVRRLNPKKALPVILVVAALCVVAALAVAVIRNLPVGGQQAGQVAVPDPTTNTVRPLTVPPSQQPTAATAEGAIAFVQHWFEVLNYATSSGDTGPFDKASSPGCQTCAAVSKTIRTQYQSGGALRGGQYTVRNVSADDLFTPERPVVRVVFDRSARSSIGGDGKLVDAQPGLTFVGCQVLLERAGDRWRVLEEMCGASVT